MALLLILIFLSPALVLFFYVEDFSNPLRVEVMKVLSQTVMQSGLSAGISLGLGCIGALGLLRISSPRLRKWLEMLVMLPGLVPALFIIASTLSLVTKWGSFPFGLWGVVLIHVVMNVGLVSVGVSRGIESRMGGMMELALVEGASKKNILWVTFRGLRSELLSLGFLVFVFSFSSFAVPLVVGAQRGETLEVLIYRAALGQGEMGYALSLSALQILFLLSFSFFLRLPHSIQKAGRPSRALTSLGSSWGLLVLVVGTMVFLSASFIDAPEGVRQILQQKVLLSRLWDNAMGTFLESLSVGVFVLMTLVLVATVYPPRYLHRFLMAYAAPSTVITGLALYLLIGTSGESVIQALLWLSVGFSLLIIPSLYRMRGFSILHKVACQVEVARVLGADRLQILRRVVLPQVAPGFSFLAAVGAFWASGDFALATIVLGREMTLGMMAQNFMGGYRLEVASAVTLMALGVGAFTYFLFEVLGHVCDSKSRP